MSALEQKVQMSEKLPTVEEYMQRRMGSSGVRLTLAIIEYAMLISHNIPVYLLYKVLF